MITGLKSQGMKNSPMLFPEQPYPALTKLRPTLKKPLDVRPYLFENVR
jgi:hypothetical protein